MALVGLMQTLALEGERRNIRVNCLAPSAATAMTEAILPPEALARLTPEEVSPGLVALVADDAPTRITLLAGAGSFEQAHITMTQGIFLHADERHPEALMARLGDIADRQGESVPVTGFDQLRHEVAKAKAVLA